MINKPTVALDCDDTIYSCNPYAIDLLNKEKGTNYTVNDIKGWAHGIGEGIDERVKYFDQPDFYTSMPVLPGAKSFVKKLCKVAEVFIVTSVPSSCATARIEAVIRDFPEIKRENILIATRKDIINVDMILDDGSHNIISAKAKFPVLFRKPWNKNLSGNLAVNNYDDFLHFVDVIRHSYVEEPDLSEGGVVCLVGPSGSGKTAIMEEITKDKNFIKPITTTTRARREDDKENAYRFISEEQFLKEMDEGLFLETTVYSGKHYGTSASEINKIIDENKYAVLPIDICGAITIKNVYRQKAKLIFIDRSRAEVIMRILERNVSNEDKMQRIISLENEYKNEILCDAVLRNDKTIEEAAKKLLKLIKE